MTDRRGRDELPAHELHRVVVEALRHVDDLADAGQCACEDCTARTILEALDAAGVLRVAD